MFNLPALAASMPIYGEKAPVRSHDRIEQPEPSGIDVQIKPSNPNCRVRKIKVHRSDAIDNITFVYSDGSEWQAGHDGGKQDARIAVLTPGEFIVKVIHEKLPNFKFAAAAIDFETNYGRVFSYRPRGLCTWSKSEQTVVCALPGMEIISLKIKKGTLVGTQQQRAAAKLGNRAEKRNAWYAIVTMSMDSKKDDDAPGAQTTEFLSWSDAQTAWNEVTFSDASAILVDCLRLAVKRRRGNESNACEQIATEHGFCAPPREEDVSVFRAVCAFGKALSSPSDVKMFTIVLVFLLTSQYFDLASKIVTGHVLASFAPSHNATASHADSNFFRILDVSDDPRANLIANYVFVKLLSSVCYLVNVWEHHRACMRKNLELRVKALGKVLSLDQSFFDTHTQSETEGCMQVHALNNLLTWNIPYLITLTLKLFMNGFFLVTMDVWAGSACVIGMLAFRLCIMQPIEKQERTIHKRKRKHEVLENQIKGETLKHLFDESTIKVFSKEKAHMEAYAEAVRRKLTTMTAIVNWRCLREFLYSNWKMVIFASFLLLARTDQLQNVPGFFLLLEEFVQIMGRVKWHWEVLVRELPDIERFLGLLDKAPHVVSGTTKARKYLQGDIVFENVGFEYPSRPGQPVFESLNMRIPSKQVTAIVGDSGGGKSTIKKLILRLYDPTKGRITIGGQDLKDFDLKELHEGTASVSQSPALFNTSLSENIAYGATDGDDAIISDTRIRNAAKLGNCYDFISKFRAGMDTFAGSRGAQMSGGQKQRIAIARAAIRDPEILLLDEATSALDAKSEDAVQKGLETLMEGKTVVIIAHRLCTVQSADVIICMKDGAMVERGTHSELMAMRGVYADLVEKQLSGDQIM